MTLERSDKGMMMVMRMKMKKGEKKNTAEETQEKKRDFDRAQ